MSKNNIFNMFIAAATTLCGVVFNPATAQEAATVDTIPVIEVSEAEEALALSVFTNGECFRTSLGADGTLQWEGHGGLYLLAAGVADLHRFSNNDGVADVGRKTAFGGDLGLGYRLVRKGWALAAFAEVWGGVNSSYHVENRVVGTHSHFGALAGVENSHGAINIGGGVKYAFDNMVSENASQQPWRGNKHKLEPFLRLSAPIAHWGRVKNSQVGNKIIPVRGLRQIRLFGEVSYNLTNKINKTWDEADALQKGSHPVLKDKNITCRVGVQLFIR